MEQYVLLWNQPELRKVSEKVEDFEYARVVVGTMLEILAINNKAVGLSAPQIGVSQRIVVARKSGKLKPYVNPGIMWARGYIPSQEGCASIPGVYRWKLRRWKIVLSYQDLEGEAHEEVHRGLMSRILQHEIDHLDGKLIID